jgi:2,3-bisphosphoglycerate-independent phosphoglycerate mutase
MPYRPIALIILDGFGLGPETESNAVYRAETPTFDRLWREWPHSRLTASGRQVGLPEGQMGNSEVGHLNLGAGRIVMQSLTYITHKIETGEFFQNQTLAACMDAVVEKGRLHIMGLVSRGGVHSDLEHLFALLEMAERRGVKDIVLHAFTDGRDVPPDSGRGYMGEVVEYLKAHPGRGRVATVIGRYYAMDRDNRWERVGVAYDAIVEGRGQFTATDAVDAVQAAYHRGETDEFIKPTVLLNPDGSPVGPMADGDSVIFFNFRGDRGRQMTYALMGDEKWAGYPRPRRVQGLHYCAMTDYDASWKLPFAFAIPEVTSPLAEVISKHGLTQYHTAETEKYPHVTFFFNALREASYPGETRALIPSPKVATYDLQPEMSAPELTERTVERILSGQDDFILINFANPDMVGHTGVLEAAIKACEATDRGLQRVVEAMEARGGAYVIVADHGNAEVMRQENGEPHTAHTTNLVPIIVGNASAISGLKEGGILADVAPTILDLMDIPIPAEMTGRSLLIHGPERDN